MNERRSARIAGAAFILVAVALALEASTFDVAFLTDPIGPKALPYFVGAILAAAGLGQLVRPDVDVRWPERPVLLRMAGAGAAFGLYAAILPLVGFFASTTAVVAALSILFGGPPARSTLTAAGLAGALWLLFVALLDLPLPIGELWIL